MANRVNITLNTQMLATLDCLAENVGMSRSEYIRHLITLAYSSQLDKDNSVNSEDVFRQMESYIK